MCDCTCVSSEFALYYTCNLQWQFISNICLILRWKVPAIYHTMYKFSGWRHQIHAFYYDMHHFPFVIREVFSSVDVFIEKQGDRIGGNCDNCYKGFHVSVRNTYLRNPLLAKMHICMVHVSQSFFKGHLTYKHFLSLRRLPI